MNLVILGDIGVTDNIIHIGDEAMFEEFVGQAKQRGAQRIIGVSSAPVDTASRYAIDSVQRIGFSAARYPNREARQDRLERILRTAAGQAGLLEPDDPAHAVIRAIAASDGAAISGGGNLSSIWPENIYERVAFGELARHFSVPLVVSGQTIGPVLFGEDVDLVARLLGSARMVGLREPASFALVSSWQLDAVPATELRQTVDDASFLGIPEGADTRLDAAVSLPTQTAPYCLITLASHVGTLDETGRTEDGFTPDDFIDAIAGLLDEVVNQTGLQLRFLAHFGSTDTANSVGDTVVHEKVIARLTSAVEPQLVATTNAKDAAQLARGATLVVSSRYHPAVFAVSTGVPTIGIPVDSYTTDKLTGALTNFGQNAILPARELIAGRGAALVAALLASNTELRVNGVVRSQLNRAASVQWWNDVMVVLAPGH